VTVAVSRLTCSSAVNIVCVCVSVYCDNVQRRSLCALYVSERVFADVTELACVCLSTVGP
jgi:hypothetical protein